MVKKILANNLIFDREKATLLLSISAEDYAFHDVEKFAKQKKLLRKKEFHITLIGRETGETITEKIKNASSAEQEKILSKIQETSAGFSWNYSFLKEYYFISKTYYEDKENEERQSVIQLFSLPDLIPFYKRLNHILGNIFEIPFPHLTLFTNSTREDKKLRGIGIYSEKQFYSLKPMKIEPEI